MSQVLFSLSTWLHAVATVVLIGHYRLLALIYLPVLAQEKGGGVVLSSISKRSRAWLYAPLLVFAITGSIRPLPMPTTSAWGISATPGVS